MAEEIIDKAILKGKLPKKDCVTQHLSIHGNKPTSNLDRENHLYIYGSDISEILKLQENEPELKEKLHPDHEFTMAEVVWAVRYEMARTIDDILARRVRLLFLDARAAIQSTEKTARIMAKELNHDENWIIKQIEDFNEISKGFLLSEFRNSSKIDFHKL
jgi:glycerol-3-phosphate dehydrogenase